MTLVDYSDWKCPKRTVLSYGHPKEDFGHKEAILAMDVSFDGKLLVTAGREGVIKVWNLNERSFVGDMNEHKGPINVSYSLMESLCFKFNSYELCSVSEDRTMKVWDASQLGFMENL